MKRRAFFGFFSAASAAFAHPAAAPDAPFGPPDPVAMNYAMRILAEHPTPPGLSAEARAQHREHIVRSALSHLQKEQVRFIAAL
jgi:hypothetical protein